MTNIQVRKNGLPRQSSTLATTTMPAWDPSRWFSRMMGFDPFREMMPLISEERVAFEPAFEIKETKDGYLFKADLPGIKLSDIEVSVTGNRLQISGKREAEKEDLAGGGEEGVSSSRTPGRSLATAVRRSAPKGWQP